MATFTIFFSQFERKGGNIGTTFSAILKDKRISAAIGVVLEKKVFFKDFAKFLGKHLG